MVLEDKINIVEEIVIEFYHDFIKSIEKYKFTRDSRKIFNELYIFYVTEHLSDELELFLRLES
jgi:hypothetical protein